MADEQHDHFFKEVDEELKRERYAVLWKKYGSYVIGAAVAVVAATAGWQGYTKYQRGQREAEGERFALALALDNDSKAGAAESAFAALAAEAGGGYRILARFQQAALQAKRGDIRGTAAAYEAIAADTGVSAMYRDLAVLFYALYSVDQGDPAVIERRLRPLTAEDNPWRYSALELTALLAERTGDRERARTILTRLGDDATAPPGLRARASELLAALGGS